MRRLVVGVLVVLAGCSTSISLKNQDGTTMTGSMVNGSMSYSEGAGCTPATPTGATPIPTTPPLAARMICDASGQNCHAALMQADSTPACFTQVATVRGTDITNYFGWVFAALGAAAVAVASGT